MSAKSNWKGFLMFAIRVILVHMITYFIFGIIMSNVFDYGEIFKREIIRDYMIPMDEHNIVLGPFLQPLRGLIFAIGLWPFREVLIEKKRGWLYLWGLIVTMGILSTPAASPSSIEGVLYSKLPMWYHLMGLPEILLQTLVFSIWLVWWERQAVKGPETVAKKKNPLVAEIVKAIMTACFAYIGYAMGASCWQSGRTPMQPQQVQAASTLAPQGLTSRCSLRSSWPFLSTPLWHSGSHAGGRQI